MHCNAVHRTATHCNALQRTAQHCNTLHRTAMHCNALQRPATHYNALQTHCNALQRTATYRNTLQHTDKAFKALRRPVLVKYRRDIWHIIPEYQILHMASNAQIQYVKTSWRHSTGKKYKMWHVRYDKSNRETICKISRRYSSVLSSFWRSSRFFTYCMWCLDLCILYVMLGVLHIASKSCWFTCCISY